MKVTVKTFGKLQVPECDIIGIDGRKIKKLKRKGYRIEIVSDLKLFSHTCIRYEGYGYSRRQEFWLVSNKTMTMYQLSTHVYDAVNSSQLYFNKSFKCVVDRDKSSSLRDFVEIDHDCEDLTINEITNPQITPVNLFMIFKDDREYYKWKLIR